jgi:hypothetical protein
MNKFPPGWDEARLKQAIEHYDSLDEDGWVAEYEAALERKGETLISVPTELVPAVHELIRRHEGTPAKST